MKLEGSAKIPGSARFQAKVWGGTSGGVTTVLVCAVSAVGSEASPQEALDKLADDVADVEESWLAS